MDEGPGGIQANMETEKDQEKLAADALTSMQFKIGYTRKIGADVGFAESILLEAKAANKARDFTRAQELAGRCRDEAILAVARYTELVDMIYATEKAISEAHSAGVDTSDAELHLSKAVSLKSRDGAGALAEALEGRKAAEKAQDAANPMISATLKTKGLFSASLRYNDWNDAILVLHNGGKTGAGDIHARVTGDIEKEAAKPIADLAPGKTCKMDIRVRPLRMGEITVEVQATCKRAYDGKTLETKAKSTLTAK